MLQEIENLPNLDELPDEMLLKILSSLSPEKIIALRLTSQKYQKLLEDNLLWRKKFVRHFPHLYDGLVKQGMTNWFVQFQIAYKKEYDYDAKKLPPDKRKFFSLVKEGDAEALTSILTLSNLELVDSKGISLYTWALKNTKHKERLLNCFYEVAVNFYKYNDFAVDVKKIDKNQMTLLHWAILFHQPASTIELLIAQGADCNAPATSANTPMIVAAKEDQAEIIEVLLKAGANINARSVLGATALMFAIECGHKNAVDMLLKYHADTSIPLKTSSIYHDAYNVKEDDTPLHAAIKLGHKDIVQSLLDAHANPNVRNAENHTPLMLAVKGDHAEIVEALINGGADIDARSTLGATALLFAIEYGHKNVVDVLLKHHADIAIPLENNGSYHEAYNVKAGDTPLHAAIKLGHKDIVQSLLKARASTDMRNGENKTPLMLAVHENQIEIAEVLIKAGADIDARSTLGATALLLTIEFGQKDMVDLLLKHDADPNLPLRVNGSYHAAYNIKAGDTPLHAAIKLGRKDIVQSLLAKGANPNLIGSNNYAPLMLAAKMGETGMVELLLTHGAHINARSRLGATALIFAVEGGHKDVVDVLLQHHADFSIPIERAEGAHSEFNVNAGDTPLHIAARLGSTAIVKSLLTNHADINAINRDHKKAVDVAKKETSNQSGLNLLHAAQKINLLPDNYGSGFNLCGYTFFASCSALELKKATTALQKVVFEGADKTGLTPHEKALNSKQLKPIYRGLRIR